ncbi:hypothetical protein NOC27_3259 [Nitrosococcus oceani AFC27]|nr:hypothetical protein NOC27_3259 [Nitrosococcus oceani AFC27]
MKRPHWNLAGVAVRCSFSGLFALGVRVVEGDECFQMECWLKFCLFLDIKLA